jgi:hypothetical protein
MGELHRVTAPAQVDEPHHRPEVIHVLVLDLEGQNVVDDRVDHRIELARLQRRVAVHERLASTHRVSAFSSASSSP